MPLTLTATVNRKFLSEATRWPAGEPQPAAAPSMGLLINGLEIIVPLDPSEDANYPLGATVTFNQVS